MHIQNECQDSGCKERQGDIQMWCNKDCGTFPNYMVGLRA